MKLNLCCGDDVRPGYINIDIRKTKPNVLVMDLEKELLNFRVIDIRNDGGTNIIAEAIKP